MLAAVALVPLASPAQACTMLGTASAEQVVVDLPGTTDLGTGPVGVSTASVTQRRTGTSTSTADLNGVSPSVGAVRVVGRTARAEATTDVAVSGVRATAETVAEDLSVQVAGTTIEVQGLRVHASRSTGQTPQLSTRIRALVVDGQPLAVAPEERTVPLGDAGTVRLFGHSSGGDHAEAVAVRVVLNGVADITIGRAFAQAFHVC